MLLYYPLSNIGANIMKSIIPYLRLIRLDKPIGILLLLWPTCWAFLTASNSTIDINLIVIFLCGVVVTRSLGCAINDLADRNIDGNVKRTEKRPLVTGELSIKNALLAITILGILALYLLYQLPYQTWDIALCAAILMIIYPFCKRLISCPQFVLGISFSCAILMVYSAIQNNIPIQAWYMFLLSTLWSVIYDTQYALTDRHYDLKIGVKSSAIWFGKHVYRAINIMQIIFLIGWILFGIKYEYNRWYYLTLIASCYLVYYQHKLIITNKPELQFKAFLNNKWQGFIILVALYTQF